MGNAVSLLAKLNPKSSNWDAIPGAGGPTISPSDVAAALSSSFGLSKPAQLLGLFFVDKKNAELDLAKQIAVVIEGEALLTGQKIDRDTASRLAVSILKEFISRSKCKRCKGAGQCFDDNTPGITKRAESACSGHSVTRRLVTCPSCEGDGVTRWSVYRQAKECGVNDRTYLRRYRHVRATGYRAVGSWLTELNAHLLEQFHTDDPTSR